MALVIRLSRCGTKKKPFYHVVVADKRKPRDGAYLERLGYYDPKLKEVSKRLEVNMSAVDAWLKKGAQVTETVGHLLKTPAKSV